MAAGLEERKRELRESVSAQRRNVTPRAGALAAQKVAAALLACPVVQAAQAIGLYAALPDELPTRPVFDALRGAGRTLALPAQGASRALVFRSVDDWDALTRGRWGVSTPPLEAPQIAISQLDVVFLPGVAFDATGARLGRGGGHYDATFLPAEPGPCLIGLAWSFQLVDAVPHDSRDRRVDGIVTENGCVLEPGRRR